MPGQDFNLASCIHPELISRHVPASLGLFAAWTSRRTQRHHVDAGTILLHPIHQEVRSRFDSDSSHVVDFQMKFLRSFPVMSTRDPDFARARLFAVYHANSFDVPSADRSKFEVRAIICSSATSASRIAPTTARRRLDLAKKISCVRYSMSAADPDNGLPATAPAKLRPARGRLF